MKILAVLLLVMSVSNSANATRVTPLKLIKGNLTTELLKLQADLNKSACGVWLGKNCSVSIQSFGFYFDNLSEAKADKVIQKYVRGMAWGEASSAKDLGETGPVNFEEAVKEFSGAGTTDDTLALLKAFLPVATDYKQWAYDFTDGSDMSAHGIVLYRIKEGKGSQVVVIEINMGG